MKRIIAALAFTILGSAGQAATLLPITLTDPTKVETARQLFGVRSSATRTSTTTAGSGKDAFLRNGTETGGRPRSTWPGARRAPPMPGRSPMTATSPR